MAPLDRYFMSSSLQDYVDRPECLIGATIGMDPYPPQTVENMVRDGIGAHANAALGLPEPPGSAADFFLREESGEIVGGVREQIFGATGCTPTLFGLTEPFAGKDTRLA